jgi:hypothetical protein
VRVRVKSDGSGLAMDTEAARKPELVLT